MLDKFDAKIIELLQIDGRMSVLQLSKELNLSRTSINERLKKLQDNEIIQGFTAKVQPEAVGKGIVVLIEVSNVKVQCEKFESIVQKEKDIIECHRVTGHNSYFMKANLSSMKQVGELIDRLIPYATLNTSVVLSSPVQNKAIVPFQ